jgi:predicted secreted Zn-dependent protease
MRLVTSVVFFLVFLVSACGRSGDGSPAPARGDSTRTASASGRASGRAAGASARSASADTAAASSSAETGGASKLHVDRTETFYDVTGRTERAILRDLARRGPHGDGGERHFGRTAWTARWEVVYEQPRSGDQPVRDAPCRMRRADVYLDVEVTLPRWTDSERAPAALRRKWSSFRDALAFHEREHQESIISAGRRVKRALSDLTASSCSALEEKAGARARSIIEEARRYNRRFDERTRHGRTQGAQWPQ